MSIFIHMDNLRKFIWEAFRNPAYDNYRDTLSARKAAEEKQKSQLGQAQHDPQKMSVFYKAIEVLSPLMTINDMRRKKIWDNILALSDDRFYYLKTYLTDPYRNREKIKSMLLPGEY